MDPSGQLQGKRKNPRPMALLYCGVLATRVLATRPPGKLYVTFKKNLIEIVFYSQKWKISAPGHKRKVIKQKAMVLSLN